MMYSKSADELFKQWWEYYFYKGLYNLTPEEMKEKGFEYEPSPLPLVEMARNRAYMAVRKHPRSLDES